MTPEKPTRKKIVAHENGVHIYEGHVAIVERGDIVYRHEAQRFERGDIVSMIYDEITGRIGYTFNGALIHMSPPPELVERAYVTTDPPPADENIDDIFAGMSDTTFEID